MIALGEVMTFGQFGSGVLQRDGGLRRCLRRSGGLLGNRRGFLGWRHDDLPVSIRGRATCSHRSDSSNITATFLALLLGDTVGKPWRRRCGGTSRQCLRGRQRPQAMRRRTKQHEVCQASQPLGLSDRFPSRSPLPTSRQMRHGQVGGTRALGVAPSPRRYSHCGARAGVQR